MATNTSRRSSIGSRSSTLGSKFRRHSLQTRNSNGSANHQAIGEDGTIHVPVIGYEVMDERARFTVFKLRIENKEKVDSWLVFRRYTDFERLSAKLKEEVPHIAIHLPPKRWLKNNFDVSFLDDRMKGLQAFVDSVLVQHKLAYLPTVRAFFCLDEPPLYPENAEESRVMFDTLEENVSELRDALRERETEIDMLKAELELLKIRNETLTKLNTHRVCRVCARRLSTNALNASTSNGELPIASSTPNKHNPRGRNRSSRSETSSVPPTPMARLLDFKSTNYSTWNSNGVEPDQLDLKMESSQDVSASPCLGNCDLQSATDGAESFKGCGRCPAANSASLTNCGSTFPFSPFELVSSSACVTPQEVDRNSSFEILSPSHLDSFETPKDQNLNKNNGRDSANHYGVPA